MELEQQFNLRTESAESLRFPSGRTLLREAWAAYRKRWKFFVSIMLVPLFGQLIIAMASFYVYHGFDHQPATSFKLLLRLVQTPETLLPFLLALFLSYLGSIALLFATVSPEEYVDVRGVYSKAWHSISAYAWISILVGLTMFGGFLLLVIPGIIFTVWYSLSAFVFASEGLRGTAALRQSRKYIRGRWTSVAWRWIFVVLFAMFVSLLTVLLGGIIPFLGGFLMGVFASPATGASILVFGVLASDVFKNVIEVLILTPVITLFTACVYHHVRTSIKPSETAMSVR